MYDAAQLKAQLTGDEGRRPRIYTDTVGKVSGGIGRNLTDKGFRDNEIDLMYENDVAETEGWLDRNLSWWRSLDAVRQLVLMNMAFNMRGQLLTFVNTLAAIKAGDYDTASAGMLNSLWSRQVGDRAERLAQMMRTGVIA